MKLRRRSLPVRGFTLVEVLISMVFLGVLLPIIVSALLLANRVSEVSERETLAAQLGENKLGELMIDNAWSTGEKRGDFGADWTGYRWEAAQANWQGDSTMTEFSLNVYYPVQGQEQSIRLTTLVSTALASASASPSPSPTP
jgi:Tfp pilus assembly protein PilV